jgi:hypothetical protein
MKNAAAMRMMKRSYCPVAKLLCNAELKRREKEMMETQIETSAGPKPARAPSPQMMAKLSAKGMP